MSKNIDELAEDKTIIDIEKKEKKERKPRKEKAGFSVEEVQDKLSALFNSFAFLLKINKDYKPSDFLEESKDIYRLSQKYSIIFTVFTILDPFFLVLNLFKKGIEIGKLWQKKQEEIKQRIENQKKQNIL